MWLLGYSGWLPRCPEQLLISYVVARVFLIARCCYAVAKVLWGLLKRCYVAAVVCWLLGSCLVARVLLCNC